LKCGAFCIGGCHGPVLGSVEAQIWRGTFGARECVDGFRARGQDDFASRIESDGTDASGQLQAEDIAAAQQDGDAIDVHGVANALGDSSHQGARVSEGLHLRSKFGEDLF